MGLRASTFSSVKYFTKFFSQGVTLKSRTLKNLLKSKEITQATFAAKLGLSKKELLQRLHLRCRFNQEEIKLLVLFLGAKKAIKVIWFPNLRIKKKLNKYVWEGKVKYTNKVKHGGKVVEIDKKHEIALLQEESGENWEQSEDFEKLIFESNELPSRKFMRTRNNGRQ